jgi:hypothetical protein
LSLWSFINYWFLLIYFEYVSSPWILHTKYGLSAWLTLARNYIIFIFH